jgi:hypothetical protein
MRMQIAEESWVTVTGGRHTRTGRLLGRLLYLYRFTMMVELVEDFIEPVIGPATV